MSSAQAIGRGAALGGRIGAVGGPWGALAGVVIGGVIAYAAPQLLAKALDGANSDAETLSTSTGTACGDCGDGPDCFEPPEGADPDEFQKQLSEQSDEINKLSPDEMLKRLSDGDARKAATGSYRGAGDATARNGTRIQEANKAYGKAYANARRAGSSTTQAGQIADDAAKAALTGKDATHALDWVAGGDGSISGLGDSKINRSIGSQWSKRRSGSNLTRREQLRKAAEKAKAQGKKKMDVDMKEC